MSEQSPNETLLVARQALFDGLNAEEVVAVSSLMTEESVEQGKLIVKEGEPGLQLYIIKQGAVEVLKYDREQKRQHILTNLTNGAMFGELALLGKQARSATVRAIKLTRLGILKSADIQALPAKTNYKILLNIARSLSERLKQTNEVTVLSLENELNQSKLRVNMSSFMILMIVILSFYIFTLKGIGILLQQFPSLINIISLPITLLFTLAIVLFMKCSSYPMSMYGLTTRNWKTAVVESIGYTSIVIVLIIIVKEIVFRLIPSMSHLPLIEIQSAHSQFFEHIKDPSYVIGGLSYFFVVIPLQELISRGALQSSLQEFFVGPNRILSAIILSNLLFSMVHVYLSLTFAVLVFPIGLFWGWLYARHKTLISPCVSHALLGFAAFYVIGLPGVIT